MKTRLKNTGYSTTIANDYINPIEAIYSLSSELEEQQVFEDNKPTGEINGYKAWFVQKGLPPFQVKFEKKIKLPDFMTLVQFDNLRACEVRYNVYFKADNIKEVK
ncbi:hypothetical protein [Streptococcus ruminantium]|uniref:hypothetical protein n=1 Tax=Streptococcus ruminantium TaxID=1917441 RepID=UPI0015B2060A|nr:hypothetical protein [Streptococcus ruminantium]